MERPQQQKGAIPQGSIDVFISHSHEDSEVARCLVALIRSALNIEARRIRCTTLDGYRLPVGANTNAKLFEEVQEAQALVALITPASLKSMYVLMELGARWSVGKSLAPLLACGTTLKQVTEPLRSLNALSCDEPAQLHQLISDLGGILGRVPESPSAYHRLIDEAVNSSSEQKIRVLAYFLHLEGLRSMNRWNRLFRICLRRGDEFTIEFEKFDEKSCFPRGTSQKFLSEALRDTDHKILRQDSKTLTLKWGKSVIGPWLPF